MLLFKVDCLFKLIESCFDEGELREVGRYREYAWYCFLNFFYNKVVGEFCEFEYVIKSMLLYSVYFTGATEFEIAFCKSKSITHFNKRL